MKFAKIYIDDIKEKQPGWRDKFLSYKELKRLIRLIHDDGSEEAEFICLLNNEIDKFNDFFIEKEEEFIIRYKELEQNIKRAISLRGTNGSHSSETDYMEMMNTLTKYIVDLHGEMVLLINYCNINYTGLAKILKKYDRKTGGLRRLPFLQKILEHPFLSTDLISELVRECENIIDEAYQAGEAAERVNAKAVFDGKGSLERIVEALLTKQENMMIVKEGTTSMQNE